MKRLIYPGSFDPVTNGHMDIIARAAALADELIVAVLKNSDKTPLFSADERVIILNKVTFGLKNVKVVAFDGLLVDFARLANCRVIVRGLRQAADFDFEAQMAHANGRMYPGLETIFLAADPDMSYVSSSLVRQIAKSGGDISPFVPYAVSRAVKEKLAVK